MTWTIYVSIRQAEQERGSVEHVNVSWASLRLASLSREVFGGSLCGQMPRSMWTIVVVCQRDKASTQKPAAHYSRCRSQIAIGQV